MNQLTINLKKLWRKSTGTSESGSENKSESKFKENKISDNKELSERDIKLLNDISNDYNKFKKSPFEDDFLISNMTEEEFKEYLKLAKLNPNLSKKDKLDTFYKYFEGKITREQAGKSLDLLRFPTKIASSKNSFLLKKE